MERDSLYHAARGITRLDGVAFNIVIDDVVFPDGRTAMGVLGGGGVQSAFGMRLWTDNVALSGSVGADFPDALYGALQQMDVDVAGVRHKAQPSARAWQIFEADGRRRQLWRVEGAALVQHLARRVDLLPAHYLQARSFHLGVHPLEPDLGFIAALRCAAALAKPALSLATPERALAEGDAKRAVGETSFSEAPLISVETFKPAERRLEADELRALLTAADVFSLNLEEAQSLLGEGTAERYLADLFAAGARLVTLRMGAEGALVADGQRVQHIPAAPVRVQSLLGAGNAFCGGFLAGWLESHDLKEAGLRGAVSASFMMEQVGAPPLTPKTRLAARCRLEHLRKFQT